MKWFIVKFLYQIEIGDMVRHHQFDEQIRLLLAFDKAEALLKAESMANGFYEPFDNFDGAKVNWKFICIAGLREIKSPHDGQEIFSALHEPEDVQAFLGDAYRQKEYLEMELMDCNPIKL
jgi:hypothetical protein